MSRFDRFKSLFGRREQKAKDLILATAEVCLGGGYVIDYLVEDKFVTKENSGIEVKGSQASVAGDYKDALFGSFAGFVSFVAKLNPSVLLKDTKFDSLLNNLGLYVALVLKSETIKVKVLNENKEEVESTVSSSLRYSLNCMVTYVLLQAYNLVVGIGVNPLGYNNIGKSRMTKLGRFLVVSITGIVKNLRFINLGLGLEFMDGTILGKLIFSLIKHRRFLVV